MGTASTALAGVLTALAIGAAVAVTQTDWLRGSTSVSEPDVAPPSRVLLGDREAASRVTRSTRGPRSANREPNQRVPTAAELARFRRASRGQGVATRVTGRFTGTTEEIVEWAAHKWGFDPDLLKAQAMTESSWDQRAVGDEGLSFGLMQIKRTKWRGSHPLSEISTAFNVDLAAAILRQAYDGRATWYGPEGYSSGDLWGSLGSYYSGAWRDAAGREYVQRVWRHLADRPWTEPDF